MSRDVLAAFLAAWPAATGPPGPATPELAALCGLTADEFHAMLLDLLPRGAAWPRLPGTVLWNFWYVPADEWTLVLGRDCALLAESYPCGAIELLPEWEATVGLPDVCTLPFWPPPLAVRQAMVCAKLAARGGQSPAYYVALAASYGFTVTVIEHFPPQTGGWEMGCHELSDDPFWWEVQAEDVVIAQATMGCWQMGEAPCWSPDATLLECVIRRAAPAHTIVTFRYPPPPPEEETRHADHA
jgi:uncharacterized protein YmfQ (DUF2313 family)